MGQRQRRTNQSRILVPVAEAQTGCVNNATPGNHQHCLSTCWISYSLAELGPDGKRKGSPVGLEDRDTQCCSGKGEGQKHPILQSPCPLPYWTKLAFPSCQSRSFLQWTSVPQAASLTASRQAWTWLSPSNEPV